MNRLVRGGLAFALVVLLVGCEVLPGAPGAGRRADWQAHLDWLETLTVWRTSGRVAVQVPDDGWTATLRWRQRDDDYRIQLSGPFGQGAVRIDGSASMVVLRTADGRERRAATPEQLIAAELNAKVPVSLLRFWILGRPAPAVTVEELEVDEAGHLQRLAQAGWLITYQQYEAHEAGALPTKLAIGQENSTARFVLDSWHTGS